MEPTPERFAEWLSLAMEGHPAEYMREKLGAVAGDVARLAYAAGADAELEACCSLLGTDQAAALRAARRRPPSLKQQALGLLNPEQDGEPLTAKDADLIRQALSLIPDD